MAVISARATTHVAVVASVGIKASPVAVGHVCLCKDRHREADEPHGDDLDESPDGHGFRP